MSSDSSKRYQVLHELGVGDFATVYAATDKKLGRDVAIKKVHPHFLSDQETLAKYWQEAQLLVTLEHPNILTIYDVSKRDGCLILELMQGSLRQIYADRPMPVEDVRQAILQACQGLQHLHKNGIIHGDIKPGNLLLSRQDLVKLGDFGLARRVNDDDGSLLKGATKYMAPELVSDQFGPVGPASDLYSLGFSALELMCGPEYDSLFPELNAFGRDRQMAWMMWHSSADRGVPEIGSMLEGVPPELAAVLQKLTTKDQSKRYQTAEQVINDLQGSGAANAIGDSLRDEEEAAKKEEAAQQKKKRLLAIGLFCTSLLVCSLAFLPSKPKEQPTQDVVDIEPAHGQIADIDYNLKKFYYEPKPNKEDENLAQKQISVFPETEDDVYLNEQKVPFRDLKSGDRVKIIFKQGLPSGREEIEEVHAYRPEQHRGIIAKVEPEIQAFVIKTGVGTSLERELLIYTTETTKFSINKKPDFAGQAVDIKQLKLKDRIVVTHVETETHAGEFQQVASLVDALRVISQTGVVREIDERKLTISPKSGGFFALPVAEKCNITLNGLTTLQQRKLKISDIQAGDKVNITHDVKIISITAQRTFKESGTITAVGYRAGNVRVKDEQGKEISYVILPETDLKLGDESVRVTDLRVGDRVELAHDAPGSKTPPLQHLFATRPKNRKKWAILVANQKFADATMPALDYPVQGAEQIRSKMVQRYGIPSAQAILLLDESRVRLKQELPRIVAGIPADAELYFYIATQAYSVPKDTVYFAPKDFDKSRTALTGIKLDWLIDLLDKSKTKHKLLLLDCCHPESDAEVQPSTSRMIQILKEARVGQGGYPRTLSMLASCDVKQRGLTSDQSPKLSLFATSLAAGFGGAADRQRDNRLDITELTDFVKREVSKSSRSAQTTKYFPPDKSLPRLSGKAKVAINNLLQHFSSRKIDPAAIKAEAASAYALSNKQPEPRLIYGLLITKFAKNVKERQNGVGILEKLVLEHPKQTLAYQAIAWGHCTLSDYANSQAAILRMAKSIPIAKENETYSDETIALFQWIGRQRELGEKATWADRKAARKEDSLAIDKAMTAHGKAARDSFIAGRKHVHAVAEDFDQQIKKDPSAESTLKFRRRRLSLYNHYDPAATAALIRAGMEK